MLGLNLHNSDHMSSKLDNCFEDARKPAQKNTLSFDRTTMSILTGGLCILTFVADSLLSESSFLVEAVIVSLCMAVPLCLRMASRGSCKATDALASLPSADTKQRGVPRTVALDPTSLVKQVLPRSQSLTLSKLSRHVAPSDRRLKTSSSPRSVMSCVRLGDLECAEQLLAELIETESTADPAPFNSVIHAHCAKGNLPAALGWIERMRAGGILPNAVSYNTFIDAAAKADDAEAAESWLRKMVEEGVEANEISFSTVLHARAKRGEIRLAEGWLQKMRDAGVEPNIVSYNSLIYACARQADLAGAEHWLSEAERQGLKPRVATFTAVMDACAKRGDCRAAERWLQRMIEAGIQPNVVSFSALIDSCAKAGDCARAKHWHRRMQDLGVHPNAHSFSAVINACAKKGDLPAAFELFEQMESTAGVVADVVVYSGLLDACAKAGQLERAKAVFKSMKANGVRPNVVVYASLARPYAHNGDWPEVERLAGEMEAAGLAMNDYFLYAQLLSYASAKPRQPQRAEQLLRRAWAQGLEVNKFVATAFGRAVGRVRSQEILEELRCASSVGSRRAVVMKCHR
eukprot:TRINITY_DN1712_c0_g1_i1.p1 TRINITY_DN1712_c0_g1~~TRINITY_DN1712_c0_g1_i1.p1  ORF type:complete len:575 (+),score=126.42 TRINITY_DN1712_c0_g1_i1:154-1878(+)